VLSVRWHLFEPRSGGFAIELPAEPLVERVTKPSKRGPIAIESFEIPLPPAHFVVRRQRFPGAIGDTARMIAGVLAGLAAGKKTVSSPTREMVEFGGKKLPAGRVEVATNGVALRMYAIASGRDLLTVLAAGDTASFERMVRSLRPAPHRGLEPPDVGKAKPAGVCRKLVSLPGAAVDLRKCTRAFADLAKASRTAFARFAECILPVYRFDGQRFAACLDRGDMLGKLPPAAQKEVRNALAKLGD
jgi:hypothetical protein